MTIKKVKGCTFYHRTKHGFITCPVTQKESDTKNQKTTSKEKLKISDMEVHHKKPKELNGTDEYNNLIIITYEIHKLIHAKTDKTIQKYMEIIKPNKKLLKDINKYRKLAGNNVLNQKL